MNRNELRELTDAVDRLTGRLAVRWFWFGGFRRRGLDRDSDLLEARRRRYERIDEAVAVVALLDVGVPLERQRRA